MGTIKNFNDFYSELQKSGFSMGGGKDKGIFSLIPFDWENQEDKDSPLRWHTGEPETDPWEWRMRVLEEREDVAYGKVFFKTSGYITKEWYPYFLAARRKGLEFEEAYFEGKASQMAKRIYDIIVENDEIALHDLKKLGGFTKEENSKFERGLVELQMNLFVTMCGRGQKKNKQGEGYGWNSTVFCTTEHFWKKRNTVLTGVETAEAYSKIEAQIYNLNPKAEPKLIKKFILG